MKPFLKHFVGLPLQACLIAATCAFAPVAAETAAEELGPLKTLLEAEQFEGLIEPGDRAFVTNAVDGVLTAIHFRPGDHIEEGQLLFETSSAAHRHRVEAAKALVLRREVELDMAWTDAERAANLGERGTISEVNVREAANVVALAEAALEEAIANQGVAETGFNATQITAPIAGQIGVPQFDVGTYLKTETGQTLARIVQTDPVLVSYDQSYATLLAMHEASPGKISDHFDRIDVTVTLPSGQALPSTGRIVFTNNTLDDEGEVRIWAEVPNPDGILVPGLPVSVALHLNDGDRVAR